MSHPHRRLATTAVVLVTLAVASGCASTPPPSGASGPPPQAPPTSTPAVATPTPAQTTPITTPTPIPLPPWADLTGLHVDPALAHRTPLAVMLDDSRAARPQSGFNGASVVYQAPADGYETRYLLVFQDGDSDAVGPVRSARFYLVQWSAEVHAAMAHFGGDRRTREYIAAHPGPAFSVDGIAGGEAAYRRITSRKAPHNAYTGTTTLRQVAKRMGADPLLDAAVHRRPFVDPAPLADRGASQRIRIPYRTNVITYRYDREANLYRRSVDGKAQIDPADGERVTTTNVVVLFQKFRIDTKIEPGHSRPDITTIGTGKALVFREGRVVTANWSKAGDDAPTLVHESDGVEIPLVRGRTFIQVVPTGTKVTYGD